MRYVVLKAGSKKVTLPNGETYDAATGVNIVSSTNATPTVLTLPSGHGIALGDVVWIEGHLVNTNANGLRTVLAAGATTISLGQMDGTNQAGNGIGGATGTVRKDVVLLSTEQAARLSAAAKDGDPVIVPANGFILGDPDDEVQLQGVAVVAPAAVTASAPAALTASVAAGSPPTKAEYDALLADVTEIHGVVTDLVADVTELQGVLTDLITSLTGFDKPLAS